MASTGTATAPAENDNGNASAARHTDTRAQRPCTGWESIKKRAIGASCNRAIDDEQAAIG
ncbi:hypothetical protein D3C75_1370760 [compost metagenome]